MAFSILLHYQCEITLICYIRDISFLLVQIIQKTFVTTLYPSIYFKSIPFIYSAINSDITHSHTPSLDLSIAHRLTRFSLSHSLVRLFTSGILPFSLIHFITRSHYHILPKSLTSSVKKFIVKSIVSFIK